MAFHPSVCNLLSRFLSDSPSNIAERVSLKEFSYFAESFPANRSSQFEAEGFAGCMSRVAFFGLLVLRVDLVFTSSLGLDPVTFRVFLVDVFLVWHLWSLAIEFACPFRAVV